MKDIMGLKDIAFPNLGLYLENIPQGFYVGNLFIHFYGCLIAIGVISGIYMAAHVAKKTGQNPDIYWDFYPYAVIFSIIGARIYYVVFQWKEFEGDLLSIFNLRQGGIAIYGAVIGAFITLFTFCKIKKQNALLMGDTAMPGLILGQVIGRWGNFFNREVFGGYTDSLLAMRIPIDMVRDRSDITAEISAHITEGTNYIQVHPTFFYESALNLLVLILMLVYTKHKKFDGEICLLYLGGYGIIRFFVEGMRTDQLMLSGTNIPVSQLVGIVCFVGAVVADVVIRMVLKKKKVGENPKTEENQI
ncbi:MAG: prolipoprotein diacylglyceryl transferase [Lachnospiraceae bacterium]|nr:prolipoprotein diacylglyceryl transferase [Lachnospiraceae bacterium]